MLGSGDKTVNTVDKMENFRFGITYSNSDKELHVQ